MTVAEFATGLVAGAAGGLATDKIKGKMDDAIPHTKNKWELFIESFPEKWEDLTDDIRKIAGAETLVTLRTTQTLQAYPYEYTLNTYNRPHLSVFALSSYQVRLFVAGVGIYLATLNAGWNAIDIPDQSTISLPIGTSGSQVVLIQMSDASLGNAI